MTHTSVIPGTDGARVAAELTQWYLANGKAGPIRPKASFADHPERNFSVKGTRPRKFLQHERQTFGINMGWTDDASPATEAKVRRWFADRPGDDNAPIRYGESVALGYGMNPSFIRYSERTVGINLAWSDTPVFEWTLLGGPIGQPVNSKNPVAIHNTKAGSTASPGNFLIYFDRTAGGDIGWPDSTTWTTKLIKLGTGLAWPVAKKLALTALGL